MKPYYCDTQGTLYQADCLQALREMPDQSVHCCVTSPPYWGLRDYGVAGQIGLEASLDDYIARMVEVFREARRVLRDDGTLWLNLGDGYATGGRGGGGAFMDERGDAAWQGRSTVNGWRSAPAGLKRKELIGIPWRVAFALQADGWYLRQDIIWAKPNPMPESIQDRCTKAHEYIFLMSKRPRYYFDAAAIKEPMADSSVERLFQDVANQPGSYRAQGKTNGAMKAVGGSMGAFGPTQSRHRQKVPGGWDTGDGAHGTIHRAGRTEAQYSEEPAEMVRNKRSVWTVATAACKEAHFATFPPRLIEPCLLAGSPAGGVVLDPFMGSGTTARVAESKGRRWVGIELNPKYCQMTVDLLYQWRQDPDKMQIEMEGL